MMLKIHTLVLGAYQVNCYLVHQEGSDRCAVIDPGYDKAAIWAKLQELGLTPEAILLTHGHFDHVGAVKELVTATGCSLWMSESDRSQKPGPMTRFFYPLANDGFAGIRFCKDGEPISVGGLQFSVLHTPGHTPGSVCYLCEDALFSGDTLFAGSVGRTDLPGGDRGILEESLKRLKALKAALRVFPGHGEATALAWEQAHNPYLR